jgi:ankyrin repeat protein/NleD-like pathogen effector protein (putative zinc metallopeptidase)
MAVSQVNFPVSPDKNEQKAVIANPFMGMNWTQVCSTLSNTKDFLSSYLFAVEKKPSVADPIPFFSGNGRQVSCRKLSDSPHPKEDAPSRTSLASAALLLPARRQREPLKDRTNAELSVPKLTDSSDESLPFWEDTDLELIADAENPQEFHQIRRSDARRALELYNAIADGNTKMKIEGSSDFKKKILKNIKILLTRPLGRQLIGNICSLKRDILIQEGERNKMTCLPDGNLVVSFNLDPYVLGISKCLSSNGNVQLEPNPAYILFAHELIHVLHRDAFMDDQNWISVRDALHRPSFDPLFTNLSEQLTIAGLEDNPTLLCENALRAEFGMPARVSHIKSEFPSYTPEDRPDIDAPNEKGFTRLENAVALQAYEETRTLLDAGANPGNGYCSAILHDDSEMVQFLLEQGADPHKADHYGNLPLHLAVFLNRRDITKLLIKGRARVVQYDATGQTALQAALKATHLYCALLLITNGAPLTDKALKCLAPQYRAKFLTYVPPVMNWTDPPTLETNESERDVLKKLPPKKRALTETPPESKAEDNRPPKKRSRQQ